VLTVQTLISEVGWDMSRFATEAHLVSFLGLSPRDKISGGKVVGREKKKNKNRAGVALKLAAGTLLNSDTYLGAQYRRLRTKLGAPKARKAMANRLARIAPHLANRQVGEWVSGEPALEIQPCRTRWNAGPRPTKSSRCPAPPNN
jgi:transposase